MMIETFYKTNNVEVRSTYEEVLSAYQLWFRLTNQLCNDEGFEGFTAHDFCVPDLFLRSVECHIQRVSGFRQFKEQCLISPDNTIPFALRTDHEHGSALFNRFNDISKSALTSLGIDPIRFGNPPFGFAKAVFSILKIHHEAKLNGLVGYSQLWALENQFDEILFVCSLPVADCGRIPFYEAPAIPPYWIPITGTEAIDLFNTHNTKMRKRE